MKQLTLIKVAGVVVSLAAFGGGMAHAGSGSAADAYKLTTFAKDHGIVVNLDGTSETANGSYNSYTNEITIHDVALDGTNDVAETVQHEIVHAIQDGTAGIENTDLAEILTGAQNVGELATFLDYAYAGADAHVKEIEAEAWTIQEVDADTFIQTFEGVESTTDSAIVLALDVVDSNIEEIREVIIDVNTDVQANTKSINALTDTVMSLPTVEGMYVADPDMEGVPTAYFESEAEAQAYIDSFYGGIITKEVTINGIEVLTSADVAQGATGADGKDGKDGTNGTDGQDGQDGADGKDGIDGVDGQDGAKGDKGDQGIQGIQGEAGQDGLNGQDGTNGTNGVDGVDGQDGADGKDGVNGTDGTNGVDGIDGKDGVDGINGTNGTDGTNGIDGVDGQDGSDGVDGTNGIDGTDGIDGVDGKDGKDGVEFNIDSNGVVSNPGAPTVLEGSWGTNIKVSQRESDGKWIVSGINAEGNFVGNGVFTTEADADAKLAEMYATGEYTVLESAVIETVNLVTESELAAGVKTDKLKVYTDEADTIIDTYGITVYDGDLTVNNGELNILNEDGTYIETYETEVYVYADDLIDLSTSGEVYVGAEDVYISAEEHVNINGATVSIVSQGYGEVKVVSDDFVIEDSEGNVETVATETYVTDAISGITAGELPNNIVTFDNNGDVDIESDLSVESEIYAEENIYIDSKAVATEEYVDGAIADITTIGNTAKGSLDIYEGLETTVELYGERVEINGGDLVIGAEASIIIGETESGGSATSLIATEAWVDIAIQTAIGNLPTTTGGSGSNGLNGNNGLNGTDGEDGTDGIDGTDGTNGVDGKDGIDGTNGVNGVDGVDGKDGIDGTNGVDGTNGIDGQDGVDGTDGADGKDGTNGTNGIDGVDGSDAELTGYTADTVESTTDEAQEKILATLASLEALKAELEEAIEEAAEATDAAAKAERAANEAAAAANAKAITDIKSDIEAAQEHRFELATSIQDEIKARKGDVSDINAAIESIVKVVGNNTARLDGIDSVIDGTDRDNKLWQTIEKNTSDIEKLDDRVSKLEAGAEAKAKNDDNDPVKKLWQKIYVMRLDAKRTGEPQYVIANFGKVLDVFEISYIQQSVHGGFQYSVTKDYADAMGWNSVWTH